MTETRGYDPKTVSLDRVEEVFASQYRQALKFLPPDKAAWAAYSTTSDYIDYYLELANGGKK